MRSQFRGTRQSGKQQSAGWQSPGVIPAECPRFSGGAPPLRRGCPLQRKPLPRWMPLKWQRLRQCQRPR
jgi:hypothetical protein